jgi:hypothetical protein
LSSTPVVPAWQSESDWHTALHESPPQDGGCPHSWPFESTHEYAVWLHLQPGHWQSESLLHSQQVGWPLMVQQDGNSGGQVPQSPQEHL